MEFFAIIFNKDDKQLFQEFFFRKFLLYDKTLFFLVSFSVIIGVLEENFFFQSNRELLFSNGAFSVIFHEGHESEWLLTLRILNTVISFSIDYCLLKRKFFYYKYMKTCFLVNFQQNFLSSSFLIEVLLEILAIHVQSYPKVDGFYSSQSMMRESYYYYDTTLTMIFLVIRMAFLLRSLLYFSIFSSAKAFRICFDCGASSSLLFTLRSEFIHSRQKFVMVFISMYIIVLGLLIRMSERSFMHLTNYDWDYVWNSFWIIIVDMTSVGYGDIVPVTSFGRVIVGIAAIGGGVVTSLIYVIFLQVTNFNRREEKAYEKIKASDCKRSFKEKAKKCVGLSMKFNLSRVKMKKNNTSDEYRDEYENFMVDIQNNVKDFANLRKTINDYKFSKKINDIVGFLKDKLTFDFDYVLASISIIDFFEKKVEILLKNVEILTEKISDFEAIYSQIIVNLEYLQEQILAIFSISNYNFLEELIIKDREKNFLMKDFINTVTNSLLEMRKSTILSENQQIMVNIDEKILQKLKKNKFKNLRKMDKISHFPFSPLNDHIFYKNFLKEINEKTVKELVLISPEKVRNNDQMNSKLEKQRKSLTYHRSLASESKFLSNKSLNSSHSDLWENNSVAKTNIVKRFEKKKLICLAEEQLL